MAFDFGAAIAAANQVVENTQNREGSSNSSYAYPLVYPQKGSTLTIRPLFNPASGQVLRLVNRHQKIACYRTYNQECPICKVMQQVKDTTGQDPFGRNQASKSRGICFAQFISSTVNIDKGNDKGILQPGEIILAMFPWSVYSQINATIQAAAQTPTGMDQGFSHAQSGLYLQIQVTNDFKYTTTPVPYMTFPTQMSDDQFIDFLDKMPSLYEQVLPSTVTDEVKKQVDEYADGIYRQYIAPRVAAAPQMTPGTAAPTNFGQQVPQAPQGVPGYVPTPAYASQAPQNVGYPPMNNPAGYATTPPAPTYAPPQNAPQAVPQQSPVPPTSVYNTPAPQGAPAAGGHPTCFGKHKDNDPQCICCPCEGECIPASTVPF